MTICTGFGIMTAPCCGARYPFPMYDSMNFSADAHWTDGWTERYLMPNEDGIRRCKCGQFLMLGQMDEDETQDGSDLPELSFELSSTICSHSTYWSAQRFIANWANSIWPWPCWIESAQKTRTKWSI